MASQKMLRKSRFVLPGTVRSLLIILCLILAWQLYISITQVNPLLVSSPLSVLQTLGTDMQNGQIPGATFNTLENLLLGMCISVVLALALASLAFFTKFGRDLFTVLTALLNPLPAVAILPLAILWFGLTQNAMLLVIVQSMLWPIAMNTDTGFRTISATTRMVAQNLGLSKLRMIFEVFLPAALPSILSGLKLGWAFGWRTAIAAELVFGVAGASGGLGWYINNARYYLNIPAVFAGLVVISLLGVVVESLFSVIERYTVIRWGMKQEK
jgi:NitT/TauT family transport system permease protein